MLQACGYNNKTISKVYSWFIQSSSGIGSLAKGCFVPLDIISALCSCTIGLLAFGIYRICKKWMEVHI